MCAWLTCKWKPNTSTSTSPALSLTCILSSIFNIYYPLSQTTTITIIYIIINIVYVTKASRSWNWCAVWWLPIARSLPSMTTSFALSLWPPYTATSLQNTPNCASCKLASTSQSLPCATKLLTSSISPPQLITDHLVLFLYITHYL